MDRYYYKVSFDRREVNADIIFKTISDIYEVEDDLEIYIGRESFILNGERLTILKFKDRFPGYFHVSPILQEYTVTITNKIETEGKYMTVGRNNAFGHCKIRIEPNEELAGIEFINEVYDETVLKREYIEAIEDGVRLGTKKGLKIPFNIEDVKITLYGGSYHQDDSSMAAFRVAGGKAIANALQQMDIKIIDEEYLDGRHDENGFTNHHLLNRENLEREKKFFEIYF